MTSDDLQQRGPATNNGRREVISVSTLNQTVARLLEHNIPLCWISGEVSNFTRAASGHWYFTLKDEQAQVRAVMFRGRAQFADFTPREGDKLEVRATVTLYAPRGDYQLSVEAIRRAGAGNLYEAFVLLKQKLASEGLFDPARKKTLPRFVRTLGIVTSLQAAALRDVLTSLKRRAPHVQVIVYPSPVQGDGAGQRLAQAVATAEARHEVDVLLIVRGGGSMEDLWAFNDELLARTIAHCSLPTISGVGHETDFTIADFVADLRAATPTAAAELAVRAREEWLQQVLMLAGALRDTVQYRIDQAGQRLDVAMHRLQSPAQRIASMRLTLETRQLRLRQALSLRMVRLGQRHAALVARLDACLPDTERLKQRLESLQRRLQAAQHHQQQSRKRQLQHVCAQLELLNPQRTLERGYAILTGPDQSVIRSAGQIQAGDVLDLRLAHDQAKIGVWTVDTLHSERER